MQSLFRDHLFIVPIHGECTQEYEVKYLALLIMLVMFLPVKPTGSRCKNIYMSCTSWDFVQVITCTKSCTSYNLYGRVVQV